MCLLHHLQDSCAPSLCIASRGHAWLGVACRGQRGQRHGEVHPLPQRHLQEEQGTCITTNLADGILCFIFHQKTKQVEPRHTPPAWFAKGSQKSMYALHMDHVKVWEWLCESWEPDPATCIWTSGTFKGAGNTAPAEKGSMYIYICIYLFVCLFKDAGHLPV